MSRYTPSVSLPSGVSDRGRTTAVSPGIPTCHVKFNAQTSAHAMPGMK
jgi:hypothetical protein